MTFQDTLWKYLGWLKKVPEPMKTIIFLVIYIPCIPLWFFYSLYLYFKKKGGGMKKRTKIWIVVAWIALGIAIVLILCCVFSDNHLRLSDQIIFNTHENGRTEIMLACLNLADHYVFGIVAEVTIQHMQTKEIKDRVEAHIGTIEPTGMKRFSVWTDKLTFGDDVGVRASFTYTGMK